MLILDTVKQMAETDCVAAVSAEGSLTFFDLQRWSEAFAAFLLERHAGIQPIILWGDKENFLLVGIIAALKACKPYVMIPNYYPPERIKKITKDCQADCVLALGRISWPLDGLDIYDKKSITGICNRYSHEIVDSSLKLKADDTVCIFYTSGSTGKPKGVGVKRKNIEAMLNKWCKIIGEDFGGDERILNFSSYAFSSSLDPLYTKFGYCGGTLYAIEHEVIRDHNKLLKLLFEIDPHYMVCTPSFIELCIQDERFCEEYLPSISKVVLGGELLPNRIAERLFERFPSLSLFNGYGSTETTIGPFLCNITREMLSSGMTLPIGYPVENTICLVVDEDGKELLDGERGELVIVSDMVVDGYLHDQDKTTAAFFTAQDGRRGFRTRDLVYKEDGLFYYVGRMDNRVKIGGYRVEIEEIEGAFGLLDGVNNCAVVPVTQDGRELYLAAYVILDAGITGDLMKTIEIKKELKKCIPAYMVPQKIVYIEKLPKNTNGKIDRCKLTEMSSLN